MWAALWHRMKGLNSSVAHDGDAAPCWPAVWQQRSLTVTVLHFVRFHSPVWCTCGHCGINEALPGVRVSGHRSFVGGPMIGNSPQ